MRTNCAYLPIFTDQIDMVVDMIIVVTGNKCFNILYKKPAHHNTSFPDCRFGSIMIHLFQIESCLPYLSRQVGFISLIVAHNANDWKTVRQKFRISGMEPECNIWYIQAISEAGTAA